MKDNNSLKIRSDEIVLNDKLISFLYTLMRDHLPTGIVETITNNSQESNVAYTNGWLAKYAQDIANRLK